MAEFAYQDLLPLGEDATPYRRLTSDGVAPVHARRTFLEVEPAALTRLAREAMRTSRIAGPATSSSWRTSPATRRPRPTTGSWPSSSSRTRAWRGRRAAVLPGHRHGHRDGEEGRARPHRRGRRGGARAGRVRHAYRTGNLRYSQMAPLDMYRGHAGSNLPAQIEIYAVPGDEYSLLFMAKGGGSANKSFLFQEGKAILNQQVWRVPRGEAPFQSARPALIILAVVIGGTSRVHAEGRQARLGPLPRRAPGRGNARAGIPGPWPRAGYEVEARRTGDRAQFGGKYFCHDVRVIRLPRHGASCPVGIAVSCSADRQALGKITRHGIGCLDARADPARFLPEVDEQALRGEIVGSTSAARWRSSEPRSRASRWTERRADRSHDRRPRYCARPDQGRLDRGEEMPAYMQDHVVYYAGPAKTPQGYASGSFGPTTAGRMDAYGSLPGRGGSTSCSPRGTAPAR